MFKKPMKIMFVSKVNMDNRKANTEEPTMKYVSSLQLKRNSSTEKMRNSIQVHMPMDSRRNAATSVYSTSVSFHLSPINVSLISNDKSNPSSNIYRNIQLEERINKLMPVLHADFSSLNLTDQDISIIVNKVLVEKQCTELWLYGNHITSQGLSILSLSLYNNPTLRSLDLSLNQITDCGIRSLAHALSCNRNKTLRILHLSENDISDNGAKDISEMLETNETLTELWLSSNDIGNEGVKHLAKSLTHNKTLKCLSLSMNKFITDLCIKYLIEMFEHNFTLKKLWLTDCHLTEAGKIELQEKVLRKRRILIEF